MFTQLTTVEEFKAIFTEIFFNKTSKVTKASNGSVINAIAFANAKLGQKITKDVAALEARIFPNSAYGKYLDDIATLWGIGQRFGATQSSTYVRVSADPGTVYTQGVNIFQGTDGTQFSVEDTYTVGQFGFGYVKVRSVTSGVSTNVDAFTITNVTPQPSGHIYCVNEYAAQFGADEEIDDVFRVRIKEGSDILSMSTLSSLEQSFMKINENVLRIFYNGSNPNGGATISVLSVNGIDFTDQEFSDILTRASKFFSMTDLSTTGDFASVNLTLQNITWFPIDISFRCDIDPSYNSDDVRKQIQLLLNKYLDYRYWQTGTNIQWVNLFEIVQRVPGIINVSDQYFYPSSDLVIPNTQLPRIRGFQMLDMDGNIIVDLEGELNPIYYPNIIDFSFQATVLAQV